MLNCVKQLYNFETTVIRCARTASSGSLISPCWHIPFLPDNTNTHSVMHHQRWGSSLFTLYSPLKDTDLYQGWPALCVPPLSPPICHWVMERLLMLLKGQWEEREMQRMLNSKPMGPGTPHPSLSAPTNLFLPAIRVPELQTTQATI